MEVEKLVREETKDLESDSLSSATTSLQMIILKAETEKENDRKNVHEVLLHRVNFLASLTSIWICSFH